MSVIEIRGLGRIKGEIKVQGSKNAVLPMMAASILNHGITVIDNVPGIQDVFCMMGILNSLGCKCTLTGGRLSIDAAALSGTSICREEMGKMRSSIMLLGALLGRTGEASVYYPGGCMIGRRPIDLHLMALEKMGAEISKDECEECLKASAAPLRSADIEFPFPSVGATENALFAAVAAEGTTSLSGCAMEPEIEELCHFLNNMGASIKGVGTARLTIEGGLLLHDSHFEVGGDRIVAGTYLCAAAATDGEVLVTGVNPFTLRSTTESLRRMGAALYEENKLLYLKAERPLKAISIKTGPHPEFPTDLQSMMMVLMSFCEGTGIIEETMFENRFQVVSELNRMGACIEVQGRIALVSGGCSLNGKSVSAADLRGGAALVLAGLAAKGETIVKGCEYIMRGYEDICRDLRSLGADIRYVE